MDTFSPIVKASTVRVVLSLAMSHKWPLRQLDVKNAFLNGILHETVYMEQPSGYVDPRHPLHVCKLKKALYGLKQAPRAWFQCFSSFLLQLVFSCSRIDTSLFVFNWQDDLIYLLFTLMISYSLEITLLSLIDLFPNYTPNLLSKIWVR